MKTIEEFNDHPQIKKLMAEGNLRKIALRAAQAGLHYKSEELRDYADELRLEARRDTDEE